jgi:hypothetical protein
MALAKLAPRSYSANGLSIALAFYSISLSSGLSPSMDLIKSLAALRPPKIPALKGWTERS